MQHQVGVSAALVAIDDLGVFRCSGQVQLEGRLSDQSQLFGVLDRVRDLAIEIVRVEEIAS